MPCVETPCVEATSESGSKRAVTSQLMNMELLPTTAAQLPAAVYDFACKCVQIAMGLRRGMIRSFSIGSGTASLARADAADFALSETHRPGFCEEDGLVLRRLSRRLVAFPMRTGRNDSERRAHLD